MKLSPGTYFVSGYRHDFEKEKGPVIQLDKLTSTIPGASKVAERIELPVFDTEFNCIRDNTRYCIGRATPYTFETSPCRNFLSELPHRDETNGVKQVQCPACKRDSIAPTRFYELEEPLPRLNYYDRMGSQDVFLAHYGPDTFSIHIAPTSKIYETALSLGAQSMLPIARSEDPHEARSLAFKLRNALSLPTRIAEFKQKPLLKLPYSFSKAQEEMAAIQADIEQIAKMEVPKKILRLYNQDKDKSRDNSHLVPEPLNQNYTRNMPIYDGIEDTTNKLRLAIQGTGFGMIGKYIITTNSYTSFTGSIITKQKLASLNPFLSHVIIMQ